MLTVKSKLALPWIMVVTGTFGGLLFGCIEGLEQCRTDRDCPTGSRCIFFVNSSNEWDTSHCLPIADVIPDVNDVGDEGEPVCPAVKDCRGRFCGPDPVCGVSCGTCQGADTCNAAGVCVPPGPDCPADKACGQRVCGPDPVCQESCGTCQGADTCNAAGVCVPSGPNCPADKDCTDRDCGPDPVCQESCGECNGTDMCDNTDGQCEPTPMVKVAADAQEIEFWQGCNEDLDKQCNDNERPYHKVVVPEFQIDKYEVTVDLYLRCVDKSGCTAPLENEGCNQKFADRKSHPVNCINWVQARSFCEWAGKRLCSESEWEKASRGTDGRKYPWGNETATCGYAVMSERGAGCGVSSTRPVGSKSEGASPYGALDMSGNVWEWVDDDWHDDYTDAPTNGSAWVNDPRESHRVARGGSFTNNAQFLRSSYRMKSLPSSQETNLGVRCCRTPEPPEGE